MKTCPGIYVYLFYFNIVLYYNAKKAFNTIIAPSHEHIETTKLNCGNLSQRIDFVDERFQQC